MGHIACLPISVVSQLRSSIILSDVAQIVDELVCNSLDAEATQVKVQIRPEGFHVAVEDNGCGITEDDFALLGERHATSKIHDLADLEGGIKTLGFRGEALSSLSEVALLDVTSRAQGSLKAFRKIMKAGKTLYLKICSKPQEYGTKVVVKEIFRNQPVRRRLFSSSQKQVLQSVKERIVRLAFMHPRVAIIVKDMAGQEIFSSRPVKSLGHMMVDTFGSELCSNLHEIDFAKGNFRLHGFVSKPLHRLPSKTLQLLYINRRFVHKTQIHKLVNDVATNNGAPSNLSKNRVKKQTFPVFVLNFVCRPSEYDITFEASKTSVEFAQWNVVLSFIGEILEQIWPRSGASSNKYESSRPRCNSGNELSGTPNFQPVNRQENQQVTPPRMEDDRMNMNPIDFLHQQSRSGDHFTQDNEELKGFESIYSVTPTRVRSISSRKKLESLGSPVKFQVTSAVDLADRQLGSLDSISPEAGRVSSSNLHTDVEGYKFGLCYRRRRERKRKASSSQNLDVPAFCPESMNEDSSTGMAEAFSGSPSLFKCKLPELLSTNFPLRTPDSQGNVRLPDLSEAGTFAVHARGGDSDLQRAGSVGRSEADESESGDWWDIQSRRRVPKHFTSDFFTSRIGSLLYRFSPQRFSSEEPNSFLEWESPTHDLSSCLGKANLETARQQIDIKSPVYAESLWRSPSEEAKIQKSSLPCDPERVNTAWPSHKLRIEGGEITISKFREQGRPAMPETEASEEILNQDTLADMYQTWANRWTNVDEREVLDLSSNADHNLLTEPLAKEQLQQGRVLQQLDKKFIAVVANGILVLVDQHAADERVRVEQLRKEVLESDKRKAVVILDHPEELSLTPVNQQILESFSEQIKDWGWRFKVTTSQAVRGGTTSVNACKVILNAVPCILKTKLTSDDLHDYLNQLHETNGSSAAPSAVTKILNNKACRGAIMFGDSLFPSECHELLAHLQKTSLCFQCAHGRPTMVSLINLQNLHGCYSPLAAKNKFGGAKRVEVRECEVITPTGKRVFKTFRSSCEASLKSVLFTWHGLQDLPASVERARARLHKARDL